MRSAIAYALVAWVIVQVATAVLPVFETPPVFLKALVILLLLGFPMALVFSWIYEVTPEGIRKTEAEAGSHLKDHSRVSRRLNTVIVTFLLVAVVLLIYREFKSDQRADFKSSPMEVREDTLNWSLAVLPFKNWSGDSNLEYVSDGMADEITTSLMRLETLNKVIPFIESLKFKNTTLGLQEISESLGVRFLLDGSVQLSGNQIRVKVQLLDALSQDYRWSEEFTGQWNNTDIFQIQANVVDNVLEHVSENLAAPSGSAPLYRPTGNMEAYKNYLKGKHQLNKGSVVGIKNAIPLFEAAVALDPTFAEAYADLGEAWRVSGLFFGVYPEREAFEKARSAWQQVLKLSKDDYLNHATNTSLVRASFYYEWDFEGCEEAYSQGTLPLGFQALYETLTGRHRQALLSIQKGIDQNPAGGVLYAYQGMALYFLGRLPEAEQVLTRNRIFFKDDPYFLSEAAKWYFHMGAYQKSRDALATINSAFDEDTPRLLALTAVYQYEDGQTQQLKTTLDQIRKKYASNESGSPAFHMALYYAHTGDYPASLDWLERSFNRHEVEMVWLRSDPFLAPLRDNPRYLELYGQVGFPVSPAPVLTTPTFQR